MTPETRSRRDLHLSSLVVGIGLVVLGVALLLDLRDVVTLRAGALAPLLLALVGAGLLAAGVRERRRR